MLSGRRATTRVSGEAALISARKVGSNSNVQTIGMLFVLSRSKIWGALRITTKPNLLGGPAGKGVATGVGVAVGAGVCVGSAGVGVSVGSSTAATAAPLSF